MIYPLAEFDGTMKQRDWCDSAEDVPVRRRGRGGNQVGRAGEVLRRAAGRAEGRAAAAGRRGALRSGAGRARGRAERSDAQGSDDRRGGDRGRQRPGRRRCSSSATVASSCRTTGARSSTARASAPTTSPARRSAKSNIFVNKPNETKYFYQDLDADGARLNGANRYTVTFAKGQTPPVQRLLVADALQRAPLLRAERPQALFARHQEQGAEYGADGSLTLYVQADSPGADKRERTGCPRRRTRTSRSTCAPIGRRRRSPTARGRRRRCRKYPEHEQRSALKERRRDARPVRCNGWLSRLS